MVRAYKKRPEFLGRLFFLVLAFQLFQEESKPTKAPGSSTATDKDQQLNRVRCPLCKWQPKASSRWYCGDSGYPEYFYDGCGTAWNTFTTRGVCPGCDHQWRWTVCLSCYRWSRHEEWYDDQKRKELE